jgi:hypothetical protein
MTPQRKGLERHRERHSEDRKLKRDARWAFHYMEYCLQQRTKVLGYQPRGQVDLPPNAVVLGVDDKGPAPVVHYVIAKA